MAKTKKESKLVPGSLYPTKTAAGDFAKGYRSTRFGRPKRPRGSVRVKKVGKKWGVFDYSGIPNR